jgi:hypothetical protein
MLHKVNGVRGAYRVLRHGEDSTCDVERNKNPSKQQPEKYQVIQMPKAIETVDHMAKGLPHSPQATTIPSFAPLPATTSNENTAGTSAAHLLARQSARCSSN